MNKTELSIARLKEYQPNEGYYLAFSGGKDSIVLYDLAVKAGVKFDAHYNLTTVDPPELVWFIKEKYPSVHINKPELSMWRLIVKKKIPPTRLARYCCKVLKEGGGYGRTVLTGVRWAESVRRAKRVMFEARKINDLRGYLLHPIIDWSEADVWNYIHDNKIEYCKLYDEGFKRLGCIMCPFAGGKHQLMEAERWPKYKDAYIRTFERMLDARYASGLTTNWRTGEDVWNWWLSIKPVQEAKGCEIFE